MERGEKLGSLQGRSERMAPEASEFLDLAKQIAEQQKRWF